MNRYKLEVPAARRGLEQEHLGAPSGGGQKKSDPTPAQGYILEAPAGNFPSSGAPQRVGLKQGERKREGRGPPIHTG